VGKTFYLVGRYFVFRWTPLSEMGISDEHWTGLGLDL